jgi:hypothetical protein
MNGTHASILLAYADAAVAEIVGCFAFWAWLRLGGSGWWLVPGMASLALFAYLLTLVEVGAAGRAVRGVRGRLHRRLAAVALGRRGHPSGPVGPARRRCVPRRCPDHPLRAAIVGLICPERMALSAAW